jgi:hypothetical protein
MSRADNAQPGVDFRDPDFRVPIRSWPNSGSAVYTHEPALNRVGSAWLCPEITVVALFQPPDRAVRIKGAKSVLRCPNSDDARPLNSGVDGRSAALLARYRSELSTGNPPLLGRS